MSSDIDESPDYENEDVVAELIGPVKEYLGIGKLGPSQFFVTRCPQPDVSMEYGIWPHGLVKESDLD